MKSFLVKHAGKVGEAGREVEEGVGGSGEVLWVFGEFVRISKVERRGGSLEMGSVLLESGSRMLEIGGESGETCGGSLEMLGDRMELLGEL